MRDRTNSDARTIGNGEEPIDGVSGRGFTLAAVVMTAVSAGFWSILLLSERVGVAWAGGLLELTGPAGMALAGFVFPPAALMFGVAAVYAGNRTLATRLAMTISGLLTVWMVFAL